MNNEYLTILSIYNKSNLKEIERITGYKNWANSIFLLYGICSIITVFLIDSNYKNLYIFIEGFIMFVLLFILLNKVKNKFVNLFNLDDDSFLMQNRLYWRGERALLFFYEIKKSKIEFDSNEVIRVIDKELELKKFDILKMPFFIGSFAVLGMLFDNLFSKLDQHWLLLLIFVVIVIMKLYHSALSSLRTEESKMNDLKLFLYWYNLFGKDLVTNKI